MRELQGKVAIVTGAGLKNGMGRSSAIKLAERGANVVVTDLPNNLCGLEEAVTEIEKLGVKGLAIAVDVSDKEQINECVKKTCEIFGGVDILFNNAGVGIAIGNFLEISDEKWDITWKVNVKGVVDFCKAVIPVMIERGGGSIINNSSLLGLGALPYYSGYVTSKFANIGLSKAIAAEFGPNNIRCNTICPGMVKTDMGMAEIKMLSQEHNISLEEAEKMAVDPVAMKRWGLPEEVGEIVAFLASDSAKYLSGVALPVAGGLASGL